MKDIRAGKPYDKRPKLPEPQGAVVDIYEPKRYEVVKLRIKRALLDDMLEQLGRHVSICPESQEDAAPDTVVIRAAIGISFGFYRWLLKYGSDVEVLSPTSVRSEYIQNLEKIIRLYQI